MHSTPTETGSNGGRGASVWAAPGLKLGRGLPALLVVAALASAALTAMAGFGFGFTHDDLMNISVASERSWTQLAVDTLTLWRMSDEARPAAALVLKSVYSVFGMNIVAWRAVYGLLLLAALGVTLALVRRLSGSWIAAAASALLLAYLPALGHLYFSMGLIFDLLAAAGTGLFLLSYLHLRPQWGLDWRRQAFATLSLAIALTLALQAKETAIVALALAALYELLAEPPRRRGLGLWVARKLPLLVLLLAAGGFAAARLRGAGSLTHLAHYQLEISLRGYLEHLGVWLGALCGWQREGQAAFVLGASLSGSLLALALVGWRWRVLAWCSLGFLGSILPVAFIPQRGVDSIFVALPVLAALAGLALDGVARLAGPRWRALLLVAVLGGVLLWQGPPSRRARAYAMRDVDVAIMPALQALDRLPRPAAADHLLVENDPFAEMEWSARYLVQLRFHLPALDVRRRNRVRAEELSDPTMHWQRLMWNPADGGWRIQPFSPQ